MGEEQAERCETCRFWETNLYTTETVGTPEVQHVGYPGSEDDFIRVGECRKNAPCHMDGDPPNEIKRRSRTWPDWTLAIWPCTKPLDWCGEWQPTGEPSIVERKCPQLLTPLEAADILRLPTRQVVKLAKAGTIPHAMLPGSELRFIESDLADWVDQHRQPEQ